MILHQSFVNFFLFLIGLTGVLFNYNNILITLVGIELMLLACNINFIIFSVYLNDVFGQLFSLFILTVAASESAIGLAILIVSYKMRGGLQLNESSIFKG